VRVHSPRRGVRKTRHGCPLAHRPLHLPSAGGLPALAVRSGPAPSLLRFGDIAGAAAALEEVLAPGFLPTPGSGGEGEGDPLLSQLLPGIRRRRGALARLFTPPAADSPMEGWPLQAAAPPHPGPAPKHPAASCGTSSSRLSTSLVWLPTPGMGEGGGGGQELYDSHALPLSFLKSLGCC